MHPILFTVGDNQVGTYALMALLALAAGVSVFGWLGKRGGHDPWVFVEMGLWAFVCAIMTAKVFGWALDPQSEFTLKSLWEAARYSGHFYAGFGAGVVYLVWALRRHDVALGKGLDYLAPGLALAHAIGRIGCFMAGCCWGGPCDKPWAVTFPDLGELAVTSIPTGVPLHPTQLYESFGELLIFAVILLLHFKRPGFAGSTMLRYLFLYGVLRFCLESLRDDPRGTVLGGSLSTSQGLALFSVLLAAIAWLVLRRRANARA